MNFTPEQRLIVGLLCDIHKKPEINNEYDAELISDAILTGNEWAIDLEYGDLLSSKIDDHRFEFVSDVLQMCTVVEGSYAQMTDDEKAMIAEGTKFNPEKAFFGFDGNNESEYVSFARFYVTRINRFPWFSEREFNSHIHSVDTYKRMLRIFNDVYDPVYGDDHLNAQQIISIMNEKIHPSNR